MVDSISANDLPTHSSLSLTDNVLSVKNGALGKAAISIIADSIGSTSQPLDADLTAVAALAGTGYAARTANGAWALRTFAVGTGLTITNAGGVAGNTTISLATGNDVAALEALTGAGFAVRTADNTWAIRSLVEPANGLTITNPAGTAGAPTFALANDLAALEGLASTGFAVRTTTDTWAQRSLTAPAAGITISNNDGVLGSPTFALANDLAALEALASTGIAIRTGTDAWAQRSLTAPAAGFTITNPAGIAGNLTFVLADDLAGLEAITGTGFGVRTAADTWATRTLTAPAAGLTISNNAGAAGNPTFALADDLLGLEGLATTGLAVRTGTSTWTTRTITGTANQISVADGSGVAGNPTLSFPTTVAINTLNLTAALGETYGGTGLATYAQGDLLYASAANTLAKLAKDANATRYLSNTGGTNNPAWAQVNLANGVTGNLPVGNLNSGTGASSSTYWRGDGTWVAPPSSTALSSAVYGTVTNSTAGIELIATGVIAANQHPPAIKFGSADADLTTQNPKFGSIIAGYFTETQSADTKGGMGIEFYITPNDPGASGALTKALVLNQSSQLLSADGSAALPSQGFINSATTGIYRVSTNVLGIATAGTHAVAIDSGGRIIQGYTASIPIASGFHAGFQVHHTGANAAITVARWANDATSPRFLFFKSRSTSIAGSGIVADEDGLGSLMWVLDDGNSYNTQAAEIRVMYDEATPGTSKGGSRMEIRTTASGAATPTTRITIYSTGGLVIGAATGGDKGTGTINAVGVYDDNTLLTCFGIEYLKYGSVDLVKWDGYAPGGKHKLAHAFINMINNNFDPRNHRSYIVKMMEDEALPGMPSQKTWKHNTLTVGEMTDRLWLAAEFQAGAIHSIAKELDGLGSRLARLER